MKTRDIYLIERIGGGSSTTPPPPPTPEKPKAVEQLIHFVHSSDDYLLVTQEDCLYSVNFSPYQSLPAFSIEMLSLQEGDVVITKGASSLYRNTFTSCCVDSRAAGCAFGFRVDREDAVISMFPLAPGEILVTDHNGTELLKTSVSPLKLYKSPILPTGYTYFLKSTCPICCYKESTNKNDTMVLYPFDYEWIGKTGGSLRLVGYETIHIVGSNGSSADFTVDSENTVNTGIGVSQYDGIGVKCYAPKPFFAFNFADGDGTDSAPLKPKRLLRQYYVLPKRAEFLAFAGYRNFVVTIAFPDGEIKQFWASGSSSNGIFALKLGEPAIGRAIEAGIRISTTIPTWALFEDISDDKETILEGF